MNQKLTLLSILTAFGLLLAACSPRLVAPENLSGPQEVLQESAVSETESSLGEGSPESDPEDAPVSELASTQILEMNGSYVIVDSNQTDCYDSVNTISCPEEGESFYGQDAQYQGNQPQYRDNGDGTVTDLVTGLMWIQDAGDKVSYYEGIASAENFSFAGYDDWRVPSIKELYSLMDFSGIDDADAGTDPFIDSNYFVFEYGDTSTGERAIDSQWITSSIYVDTVMNNQECFFGVNFADGRIKCYPTQNIGNGYFLRLVRGDSYGLNDFEDNADGTITDLATGLTWQQADSLAGMDWSAALNYCEDLSLAGNEDWRLPNAKELQSIVDYSRSPDTSNSAAIDPIFEISQISNEAGQADYAYYWSSSTHANRFGGSHAVYLAFGRALGDMGNGYIDVHGAGAQRSDPKSGSVSDFPYSFGPQGDVARLNNYVRCVSGGISSEIVTGGEVQQLEAVSVPASEGLAAAPPPQEAIDACSALSQGAACSVGPVLGSCSQIQEQLACLPANGLPGSSGPPGDPSSSGN